MRAVLAEFVEEFTNRVNPVQFSAAVRVSEIVLSERDQVLDEGFITVAKVEGVDRLAWEFGDGVGCFEEIGEANEHQSVGLSVEVEVLDGVGKG